MLITYKSLPGGSLIIGLTRSLTSKSIERSTSRDKLLRSGMLWLKKPFKSGETLMTEVTMTISGALQLATEMQERT